MKKDQRKVVEDLSAFLNHPLTVSQKDSLVHHIAFEDMKANPNANPLEGMQRESGPMQRAETFFRKGEVGHVTHPFLHQLINFPVISFSNNTTCQVGDWKKFFTPEKAEERAAWIKEKTAGCDGLQEKIPPF